MNLPQPVDTRVFNALILGPLSVRELARCLSRSHDTIRRALYSLRNQAVVEVYGKDRLYGQRWRLRFHVERRA